MPSLSLTPTTELTPSPANIVELTVVNNTPVIDIITTPPPVVEIAAVGLQGPPGVTQPTVETHDFSVFGNLTPREGTSRVYFDTDQVVTGILASVGSPPAGAPVRVDVRKNGVSLYTDPSDRPLILAGTNVSQQGVPAVTSFTAGDYMTVAVLQTGTTVPGAHLTVTVRTRRVLGESSD